MSLSPGVLNPFWGLWVGFPLIFSFFIPRLAPFFFFFGASFPFLPRFFLAERFWPQFCRWASFPGIFLSLFPLSFPNRGYFSMGAFFGCLGSYNAFIGGTLKLLLGALSHISPKGPFEVFFEPPPWGSLPKGTMFCP